MYNTKRRILPCSKMYSFDPTLPEERRRLVLTISPLDWAVEWLRPITPDYKYIGPVLAGPGKPLSSELEVRLASKSFTFYLSQKATYNK